MSGHASPLGGEDAPSITHSNAYATWLQTKATENDVCKMRLATSLMERSDTEGMRSELSRRMKIIVVDDEPNVAITLSEILRRRGYSVVWFTEPLAASEFLVTHEPDLLLSDVTMPVLDGIDLALQVKRMHPDCPVLLVSAIAHDPLVTRRIQEIGLDVSLAAKPLEISLLLIRIADLTSTRPVHVVDAGKVPAKPRVSKQHD